MNVIFLDIDGVLNNENHAIQLIELLGREQYFQLHRDLGEMPFDYRSVKLLQQLVKETGAEIVLSSTWRISPKHIEFFEKYTGLKVAGKTPRLPYFIRGQEIAQYLYKHREIVNYVIIDDDSDMLKEQKEHFVKVDAKKGFTKDEFIKCERILSL